MAKAPLPRQDRQASTSTTPSSASSSTCRSCTRPSRAELNARRQGTASTQDARRGRDDRRQGLPPEGHRPRPRRRALDSRSGSAAASPSAPSRAATPSRSTARRAAARCARRCRVHARPRLARGGRRRPTSTSPRPSAAAEALDALRRAAARWSCSAREGEDDCRQVVPQHRAASTCCRPTPWASPTSSAPPRLVLSPGRASSTSPHDRAQAERRRRRMNARSVIIRPIVSEKSYALLAANKYTFRVHDRRPQDADPPGRRGDLRRARARRAHDEREVEAEAPRLHVRPHARVEEGGRRARTRTTTSSSSRVRRWASSRWPSSAQAHLARPPLRDLVDRAEVTQEGAREVARRGAHEVRRAQHARPHHLAPPRRRREAPATARSTSSAARTACPRRSPRSSTTRTAPPTSRCSTTPTARSATSSRRSGCGWA